MRSRSNGGIIGAYQLPTVNSANGVFFIHDAAIYNTGANPIWPLGSGFIYSATGGTITNANATYQSYNSNYKVHTFTANGTFTVVNGAADIEILLVGGGGAGGWINSGTNQSQGGGGGGGGVSIIKTRVTQGTVFTVEVGLGGSVGVVSSAVPTNGKPSKVTSTIGHSYNVPGGGAGGRVSVGSVFSGITGGSAGGQSAQLAVTANGLFYVSGTSTNTSTFLTNDTIETYVNAGGAAYYVSGAPPVYGAGGGGGAAEAGHSGNYPSNPSLSGYGGAGWLWNRTGLYYGAGGGGGRPYSGTSAYGGIIGAGLTTQAAGGKVVTTTASTAAGVAGLDQYGQGGGGASQGTAATAVLGGAGGDGCVIFCYRYK